jgi:hypothetical protein
MVRLGDQGHNGWAGNHVEHLSFNGGRNGKSGVTAIQIGQSGGTGAAWQQSTIEDVDIASVLNGIDVQTQAQNVRFNRVTINNNGGSSGIGIQVGVTGLGGDNAEFFDNLIITGFATGIKIGPRSGAGPAGIVIRDSDIETNSVYDIDVESAAAVTIDGDYFEITGAAGINVGGPQAVARGVKIINCYFSDGSNVPIIQTINFSGLSIRDNYYAGTHGMVAVSRAPGGNPQGGIYEGNQNDGTLSTDVADTTGWEIVEPPAAGESNSTRSSSGR